MPRCSRCLNGEDRDVCPHYGIAVHAILTDLIADLRGMAAASDHLTEWIGPTLEHADDRLKGLNNE